ncbi:carbohydrate kinase family protein [Nocardioides cavernaquae]|uniref:Carbohydrate kinase n=1 Tax=Nocardioides cavernaquae TaxID=2321396 RepID=A0A3A5H5H1_9ACTN|nr:carbohydrate kinase [Nocardioides cavernaquae]RJS45936.1 carbohydrate kinase [Nocardioides cavernaquae]
MLASPPETDDGPDRALVIGEALIDLIRRPGQADAARVGGSPLNVAVGLSRLEVPAVLQTRIGCDAHGALIEEHLSENDVELVTRSITAGPTSTALATIAADGAASYEFAIDWSIASAPDLAPDLVHTGSIAAVLEPGASVVLATIEALRATATISYDPNVRPQLMGSRESARKRIEEFVERADVVKASDEDLAWLFPDTAPADVARRWLRLGPALVVVTLGPDGAYAAARGGAVQIPAPPTTVVDTIGAGDSFMAGLLVALFDAGLLGRKHAERLKALDLEQIRGLLEFAAGCAAVTVSRPGADPPRRDRIMAT